MENGRYSHLIFDENAMFPLYDHNIIWIRKFTYLPFFMYVTCYFYYILFYFPYCVC